MSCCIYVGPTKVRLCFAGVQIATKQIDEGVAAGLMAAEAGATWLDLNCGCPIYGTHADTHTFHCLLSLSLLSPEPDPIAVDHTHGLGHLMLLQIDVHNCTAFGSFCWC